MNHPAASCGGISWWVAAHQTKQDSGDMTPDIELSSSGTRFVSTLINKKITELWLRIW